jgi:SAM-dependent methyltransferase
MSEALNSYQQIWSKKPVLRAIYGDLFDRLAAECAPGKTLEIGGGVGGLKDRLTNIYSSDIQAAPWLDLVADAQALPFATGSLSNIVLLDVLHHIEFPVKFFREAARVLRSGGRIVMVEPAITPGSTGFYRFLHQEPVRMAADPLADGAPDPNRDPYISNQAIPTLLATRDQEAFAHAFPDLALTKADWFSFLAYPLSGGFKPWSALPAPAIKPLLGLERALEKPLGRLFGFRLLLRYDRR